MIATLHHSLLAIALVTLLELAVIARILLRPHRDPASRIAWVVVVGVFPLLGILAYLLLGEVNIGRRRVERLHAVLKRMPPIPCHAAGDAADPAAAVPERHQHLFCLGHSISGFHPVGGNTARLLPNSNTTIDAMVADIDSATDHVHVLFYIWLPDYNGSKVVEALKRAAARGVTCRAMADDLGSRTIIPAALRGRVAVKAFSLTRNPVTNKAGQNLQPQQHGDFSDSPFWDSSFWQPDAPMEPA